MFAELIRGFNSSGVEKFAIRTSEALLVARLKLVMTPLFSRRDDRSVKGAGNLPEPSNETRFYKEQRIMALSEVQVSKEVFNSTIRTTFGKLDEQDIAWIDGRSSALVHQLCLRYGYETVDAEHRVELFESKLDRGLKIPMLGLRM